MPLISAQFLREIVSELIAPTISLHRASRSLQEANFVQPAMSEPTEEEIDDFVRSNPLLDSETVAHLTDPGFLGPAGSIANAPESWIEEFKQQVRDWASTNEWHAADLIFYHDSHDSISARPPEPAREVWTADDPPFLIPQFFANSPSHLLLADKLLREGRLLSEMGWREFEKLIGELLQSQGWQPTVMGGSKDGGIDVLAERTDPVLGQLRAIWQAKKYATSKKVQLCHLRELSAVVDRERATKGVIVTTSSFTRGAFDWVQRDLYRLEAKDGDAIEKWIRHRLYHS